MATPCITTLQYQNQGVNIGTTHSAYSDLTSYVCTVCVVLGNFITHSAACNHNHNHNQEVVDYPYPYQDYPFVAIPTLRPILQTLTTTNLSPISMLHHECYTNGIGQYASF